MSEVGKSEIRCPKCNEVMHRVFTVPNIVIDSNQPKTIGDLADKNTERMVKEGKLDKDNMNYGTNRRDFSKKKNKMKDIANMSPSQKKKYIFKGN